MLIIRIFNSKKEDIETIKKKHSEIKNARCETNNTLEWKKSRLDEAEDRIRVLEER